MSRQASFFGFHNDGHWTRESIKEAGDILMEAELEDGFEEEATGKRLWVEENEREILGCEVACEIYGPEG
jgi:hypothetical protein